MDLARCTADSTPLTVLERRREGSRSPLLSCPSCGRRYVLGRNGPEVAPDSKG